MHGPGGPRGGFHGGPRGGYGPGYGGPHGGHHRPHHGYYRGRRGSKLSSTFGGRNSSDGSMLGEFKGTMKYKMYKHGVFLGIPVGLVSFFITNPLFDIQYTYRKNALEYSKSKNRITEEQFNLRMIRLEESNAANMYRNGYIDEKEYDSMMDNFEAQYLGKSGKSK